MRATPGTPTTPSQKTSWSDPPLWGMTMASNRSRDPRKDRMGGDECWIRPASSEARNDVLERMTLSAMDSITSLR